MRNNNVDYIFVIYIVFRVKYRVKKKAILIQTFDAEFFGVLALCLVRCNCIDHQLQQTVKYNICNIFFALF